MTTKKRYFTAILIAVAALCLLAGTLFFNTANASNSASGTNTADEWKGAQTTGNLIYYTDNNSSGKSKKTLADFGWQGLGNVDPYALRYNHSDVGLGNSSFGWVIHANTNDGLGNDNYTGGVWYTITLSEADRVKANKGDLTISASSVNWHQTSSGIHARLQLIFYDAAGSEIASKDHSRFLNIFQNTNPVNLSISDYKVPANTATIRYYISNNNSLAGKPSIGALTCTLTDKTAPAVTGNVFLEKTNVADSNNNIVVAGNTIKYSVEFNEKVSITANGTANITLNGNAFVSSSTAELVTENGKSRVCYTFTLPDKNENGEVKFSSVSGLAVKDEAGNAYTYNNSGLSAPTLQYYRAMTVSSSLTHLNFSGGGKATYNTNYSAALSTVRGYNLPNSITVKVGGSTLAQGSDYTYNSGTGAITITGSKITDDIVINASGVAKKIDVTLNPQSGFGGTDKVTATFDSAMPGVVVPTRTGYTFDGYYTQADGEGVRYYDAKGQSVKSCDFVDALTLYAHWVAHTYTITFNKNKPGNASEDVQGTMSDVPRTYDDGSKALPKNGFTLTGWTFLGWATNALGGSVTYDNEKAVQNLTDRDGDTFTLYAVWRANTYTVNYHSNKPSGASSEVVGATNESSHTYDVQRALTTNGFSLTGWTFQGWAASAESSNIVHRNDASVKNLTAVDGATIHLYAVWTANTYTIRFNENKPKNASANVQGSISDVPRVYDDGSKALPHNDFTLHGWTFQGWTTSVASDSVTYTNGQPVQNLTEKNDETVTLYAVWKANSHTITLNAMGGTNAGALTATFDSALPGITLPERHGYNFRGYFNSESGGEQYYKSDGTAVDNKTFTIDDNITLYAQWTPITYTIRLYSEGKYIKDITGVVFGVLNLPAAETCGLSRKNFDFVGWNIYDEQNWAMYHADTLYTTGLTGEQGGVVVLYAAWQEKPIHSLFYDANGGFGAPATEQLHEEEEITLSDVLPAKDDHTFVGWAVTAEATEAKYSRGDKFTMGSAAVTLYAVWKHNPSFTYNANEGTFNYNVATTYPAPESLIKITEMQPVRTGYEFIGWAADKDAEKADYNSGDSFTMHDEDIVLYAVWKRNDFTVFKNIADGYGVSGLKDSYSYGDDLKFTVSGEYPKVYINGTLVSLDEDGYYSFKVTGNISVTVVDVSSLVLLYSANGGEDAPTDETIYSMGKEATVSEIAPVRLGYTFCGWSDNKNAEAANYNAKDSLTFSDKDMTLYAVWRANSYTVTYNAAGCAGTMPSNVYTYGTIGTLSENAFERQGFIFVGWALSEGGECLFADGDEVLNLSVNDGDEVTLYAVWEQLKTLITFDSNGGGGGSANLSVGYGETLPASGYMAPVRRGYTFAGYYTQKGGNGDKLFDENMCPINDAASNWHRSEQYLTLYAYWIPTPETIEDTIDTVQDNLNKATEELQSAIDSNQTDIKGKISALDSAYQAADELLRSELTSTDDALEAKIAALEKKMEAADSTLQSAIDAVQIKLEQAAKDLQAAIDANEKDIEAKVAALDAAYQAADELLRSEMMAADTMIDAKIDALEQAMHNLDSTLQSAIDAVQSNLDKAAKDLQATIDANETDIEAKFSALDAAYQLADKLLRSDMTTADDALDAKIAALEQAMKGVDSALQSAIDAVQSNLDKAAKNLQATIDANETDIEAKFSALDAAYQLADKLLRSDMTTADDALDAKIAALEKAMKNVDSALQSAIDAVQSNLDKAAKDLQATIDANETDIEAKVAALDAAYQLANKLLRSDMTAADDALDAKIAALEQAMKSVDSALQSAIDAVQSNLDKAAKDLQATIDANETDIEAKVAALDAAYQAADTLLRSDMTAADDLLDAKIEALKKAMKNLDFALQASIDNVQRNLDRAAKKLQAAIDANETDIEAKVAALEAAYKAADALINSDIAGLKAQDSVLAQSISALDSAYKAADEALWKGIRQVEQKHDALEQQSEKTALIYMIINIVLGCIAVALIVTLVVKVVKKKNSQQ